MIRESSWVVDFADGSREQRDLLGGKGAGIAEMTHVLGAELVPGGFTITTEACVAYMRKGGELPAGLAEQVEAALERLQERAGKRLGDAADPLLVSVRSGARESMPGMLDTVLNLGLNDETVLGLAARSGSERFAWDSYRRFVQMYGNVVAGIPGERFEEAIAAAKERARRDPRHRARRRRAARADLRLPGLLRLPRRSARAAHTRDPGRVRLLAGRARRRLPAAQPHPRRLGHGRQRPADGVRQPRREQRQRRRLLPRRGHRRTRALGDFLTNAQGEDVVSGVRTPPDIGELRAWLPEVHEQLMEILRTLERHYGDMQDTEFTVQEGRLYMLQTRNAKRPRRPRCASPSTPSPRGCSTARRRS